MAKILVVEDDADLARRLKGWLAREQHTVDIAPDGDEGLYLLSLSEYELVILDWQMPKLSGLDLLKEYRNKGGQVPVLMLTGKQQVGEKATGLDSGADDYLTKPFELLELTARVRALLRRKPAILGSVLTMGPLVLDTGTHRLTVEGKELPLLPKEQALLEFLMRHPDEIFSPEALLNRVWSAESESTVYTVYTNIKTLRKKLSSAGACDLIKMIYGRGYRLKSKSAENHKA